MTRHVPAWAKVLVPAGIAAAMAVGASAYTRAVGNEHRLTAVETALAPLPAKLNRVEGSLNRIEGALAERNRYDTGRP